MDVRKLVPFILQGLVVGVVGGFLFLVLFRPERSSTELPPPTPQYEIGTATTGAAPPVSSGPVSYADAVDKAAPAVVNIYTAKETVRPNPLSQDPLFRYFFGEPQPEISRSLGSGVILSKQGYILTNNHVVAEADEIVVALRDGRSMAAQLVGTDPETDLAVLTVKAQDLPAITLGDSNTIRVGDVVLAIGNPFGVGQTVTMGIISATGRSELGITTFENFIQTDAAINPGNSGGALVNAYGQLLGINTAILSQSGGSQGVGFAIPIAVAKIILEQIISHGRAVRGWIGVGVQDLNPELAESLNLDAKEGALVTQVLNNSPAEQAGLQPGDVISHINGKQIDSSKDLINLVTGVVPGKRIELRGQRGREKVTLDIEVGERPQPRTPPQMRVR